MDEGVHSNKSQTLIGMCAPERTGEPTLRGSTEVGSCRGPAVQGAPVTCPEDVLQQVADPPTLRSNSVASSGGAGTNSLADTVKTVAPIQKINWNGFEMDG